MHLHRLTEANFSERTQPVVRDVNPEVYSGIPDDWDDDHREHVDRLAEAQLADESVPLREVFSDIAPSIFITLGALAFVLWSDVWWPWARRLFIAASLVVPT